MAPAPGNAAIPLSLRLLQECDRRVGAALVRSVSRGARQHAGPASGAPLPPAEVRRVLVIRPGGLGDAVLLWPALEALRAAFPMAQLDVLGERRNAGAFGIGEPRFNVLCYDAAPLRVLRQLRAARYDLVVDTEQYHHLSTLLANALRPRWLCGFGTLGRERLQTHTANHDEDTYEALAFLRLVAAVTGHAPAFDPDQPFIRVSSAAAANVEDTLRPAEGRPIAAIMPVAGSSYRLWAADRYASLAQWLIGRGHHVVLLGGGDGKAAAGQIAAAAATRDMTNLVGRTTLVQSAAILARSRLAVSSDTGVLHLAYGIGTPTVGLFGPGLFRKWGPPGRAHRIVRRGLPCSPCIRFGVLPPCPYDVACMREITVAEVIGAVEDLLQSPDLHEPA